MNSPLISLKQVRIGVGRTILFNDLNWELNKGAHWIITGNCGVGKTILAEFLANKHRLAAGSRSYSLDPKLPVSEQLQKGLKLISFTDTGDLFLNYRNVHYYQQRFNAFDSDGHLTIREYFEKPDKELEEYQALLERMDLLRLLDKERIKLSSGQTRKMLLVKVMMSQPQVLILDNAYIGLDKGMRRLLNQVLDELVEQSGMSLVLAGHHRELPQCISHHLHIHTDRKIEQGQVPLALPSPSPVLPEKPIEGIRKIFQKKHPSDSFQEILRMDQVSIQYGSNTILNDINWTVKPGEKWAVYGPNGSGKSTLLSLIYADNPQAYSKEIYLFDKKRGSGESIWEIKSRIGFSSPELHAYFRENPTAQQLVFTGLTDTFSRKDRPRQKNKPYPISFSPILNWRRKKGGTSSSFPQELSACYCLCGL